MRDVEVLEGFEGHEIVEGALQAIVGEIQIREAGQ